MLKLRNLYIGLILLIGSLWGISSGSFWWNHYYFAFAWIGWVFFVDGLCYLRRKDSLLTRMGMRAFALFILALPFWHIYYLANLHLQLWTTSQVAGLFEHELFYTLAHSSILPAFLVMLEFFMPSLNPMVPKQPLTRYACRLWVIAGLLSLLLSMLMPKIFFPLIFCFLAFVLDPINYAGGRPSFLYALCQRKWLVVASFVFAGLVLGFFWESLNGIARGGWNYRLPYFNSERLFVMPALGFLGYIPFGVSAFAFYYWVKGALSSNLVDDRGQIS